MKLENENNEQPQDPQLNIGAFSERYLLIEWIQGHPVIDGAKYADTNFI